MVEKTGRIKVLKAYLDPLSREDILRSVEKFVSQGNGGHQIVTANSLMTLSAENYKQMVDIFKNASLVLADSVGMTIAAFLLTGRKPERIPGIELIDDICSKAAEKGWPVFLLGSAEGVAKKTAEHLSAKHKNLQIAGYNNGFFQPEDNERIVNTIANLKPDILFVGLDVPRQEKWIHDNLSKLNVRVAMGIGGSMDILSGNLKRAPHWMRFYGLEWLYRLIQEPWRLNRIMHLPEFAFKAVKQLIMEP